MLFKGLNYLVDVDLCLVILRLKRRDILCGLFEQTEEAFLLLGVKVQPLQPTTRSPSMPPTSPRSFVRTLFSAASENSEMFFCALEP